MNSRADQIVAAMEAAHPAWQVWYVLRAVDPLLFCARRWDGTGQPVSSADPDELAKRIKQES